MKKTIGVLVGSQRRDSYSKKAAYALANLLADRFVFYFFDLGVLPIFDQDADEDGDVPPSWTDFREKVAEMDGFLFVTPEYNRSLTPLMKNALDIASRPYGQNRWDGKPGLLVGVSPGKIGAFGACGHLRQALAFLNVLLLQQPEVYLGEAQDMFDDGYRPTNPGTEAFLRDVAGAFTDWVERFS